VVQVVATAGGTSSGPGTPCYADREKGSEAVSPVATVRPCPLAIDAYAAADRDLGFPRPDCPWCGRAAGVLAGVPASCPGGGPGIGLRQVLPGIAELRCEHGESRPDPRRLLFKRQYREATVSPAAGASTGF
jgi:hypothetical protein